MVVTKQVNFIKCLSIMLIDIKQKISTKFSKFYMRRITELGLNQSKTFSYIFQLGNSGDTVHRRSLAKLKGLISKAMIRTNPALQLANTEVLPTDNHGHMIVNLFSIYYGPNFPMPENDVKLETKLLTAQGADVRNLRPIDRNAIMSDSSREFPHFQSINEVKGLFRYARYLNYLARKNDIPLAIEITRNYKYEGETVDSNFRAEVIAQISFAAWVGRGATAHNRYRAIKDTGTPDDALFSSRELWTNNQLQPDGSSPDIRYKAHAAKIFVHLDKVLKVLDTLSRKVEYGYSAFTFRT